MGGEPFATEHDHGSPQPVHATLVQTPDAGHLRQVLGLGTTQQSLISGREWKLWVRLVWVGLDRGVTTKRFAVWQGIWGKGNDNLNFCLIKCWTCPTLKINVIHSNQKLSRHFAAQFGLIHPDVISEAIPHQIIQPLNDTPIPPLKSNHHPPRRELLAVVTVRRPEMARFCWQL